MLRFLARPESVFAIVAVAIALRLGAGWYFESRLPPGEQFEFGDSDGYWYLGQQIAAGKPYEYRSPDARIFRMPGYPAVLAPIFLVLGPNASPMWGRGLSAVLGGITAALVVWWGTLLFDLRAGLLAGWITSFYPGAIAMGSFILSEAPFMPLMVAHLALAAAAFKATTTRNSLLLSIASGVAAAGAIYMRPSWLLFVPFACFSGLLLNRERWRIVGQSTIAVTVIALSLQPWLIRNYIVTAQFVPTTLQVGISLKDGLSPLADGASDLDRAAVTIWEPIRGDSYEWGMDRIYRREAIEWALANLDRTAILAGIKFSRLWNFVPNETMFRSWPIKLLVAVTFTPLFLLGGYGVIKFTRLGWPYLLAGLPALYFTLLHMIFVASIRYREPAILGLIVLASGVIAQWVDRRGNSGKLTTAIAGG